MMNPDTNLFEEIKETTTSALRQWVDGKPIKASSKHPYSQFIDGFVDCRGNPIPKGRDIFSVGEVIQIKNWRYAVVSIEPDKISFKPVGPGQIRNLVNKMDEEIAECCEKCGEQLCGRCGDCCNINCDQNSHGEVLGKDSYPVCEFMLEE